MSQGLSPNNSLNGISVLIPVYNRDVVGLVSQVLRSIESYAQSEIRIYDDASTDNFVANHNKKQLFGIEKVIYQSLPKNLGRSKIRNLLAKEATYDFLVFIDCDSALPDPFWIKRYWDQRDNPVLYGGTLYEPGPIENKYRLHYTVGNSRETRNASVRNNESYRFFTWNNVAIHKKILEAHPIPEIIQGYGHEDTLFSFLLQKAQIPIVHIDNPVIHLGLESNKVFLGKGEQAVINLINLANQGYPQLQHRLYSKWMSHIHVWLQWIPVMVLRIKINLLKWLLTKGINSPTLYDLFKLLSLEIASRNPTQKRN